MATLAARMAALATTGRDAVMCGDWNIAHREADIKNWKGNVKKSGFLPSERQWLTDLHNTLKGDGVGKPPEFLVDDFNDELIVVYAEDDPNRTRYLTSDEIQMDRAELRKLALANLEQLPPKIEMRNHDNVFSIMSAGGDYEASLLLFDHIWSGGQIKVDGDIVVAVPARDVLLITGSKNRKGLQVVRAMAADMMAKASHRLTDTLFVYRDGRFKRCGRKS